MSKKVERNKNDTWGEKELSKYISGSSGSSSKKIATSDAYSSYGSPKSQVKRKSGTGDGSTKQTSSSAQKQFSSSIVQKQSGTGKRVTIEDKARERSSSKTKTDQGASGHGVEKGDSRRVRPEEPSGKRSSKDLQGVRDPKASSRRRDKAELARGVESKSERTRSRDSRGHETAEVKSQHQSLERDRQRRKEESTDRKMKGKGTDKEREKRQRREREAGHVRSSGSRDKHGKEARREERKREIVVRGDPPPTVPEGEAVVGTIGVGEGHDLEGNPPQQMVEVTEEVGGDEYHYDDEEFEDYEYEEDFDEVPEEEEETAYSESEDNEGHATPTPTKGHGHPATTDARRQQQDGKEHVDLLAIMQAIDAENMAVETTSSQTNIIEPSFENVDGTVIVKFTPKENDSDGEGSEAGRETPSVGRLEKLQSPSRKFVDFSIVQKKEAALKIAKKTRKRAQELLAMIELDIVSHNMFDLPPLSEYELYVKKFGADDTRQAFPSLMSYIENWEEPGDEAGSLGSLHCLSLISLLIR